MLGFLENIDVPISNNMLFGANTLRNDVGGIGKITQLNIANCNARYVFADSNTNSDPTNIVPDEDWQDSYIMDGNLGINTQAGSLEVVLVGLNKLLIKRREHIDDNLTSDWITIAEIFIDGSIEEMADILAHLKLKDRFAKNNTYYDYAIVPVLVQGDVVKEGVIVESEEGMATVLSSFDGIFICDNSDYQKIYANAQYDNLTTIKSTGVHETLGGKYPIVVENSALNYQTGGISGTVLNKEYFNSNHPVLDRSKIVLARKEFEKFITNRTPKIVKDWNSNIWLTMPVENIDYTFYNQWGMGLGDMHFAWVEIGDLNNEDDLRATGMITIIDTGGEING